MSLLPLHTYAYSRSSWGLAGRTATHQIHPPVPAHGEGEASNHAYNCWEIHSSSAFLQILSTVALL